jgi:6-phosphogluconolactonase
MNSAPETSIHSTAADLVEAAATRLIDVIAAAQRERGVARVVLTGGSNGIALLRALASRAGEINFPALHLYFGDDRFVPADDADRNAGQARTALLDNPAGTGPSSMYTSSAWAARATSIRCSRFPLRRPRRAEQSWP